MLTSCVAPGGTTVPQTTRVAYYPQCYQSVAVLRQQDQQFQQAMAVNTLAEAATGAALGAAIGRDWQSEAREAGGIAVGIEHERIDLRPEPLDDPLEQRNSAQQAQRLVATSHAPRLSTCEQ